MGAAGDMLMAALLELHCDPQGFLDRLNNIGIPGVNVTATPSVKHGINGTHISVIINGKEENTDTHNHGHSHDHGHSHIHDHNSVYTHTHDHEQGEHSHGSYDEIEHLIGHLKITDVVKKSAIGVYKLIAEAESHAHGVPVNKIHFHEVGEIDAIADIVGVCMLINELAPDMILSSPVNTGNGHVRCAHGILPVPAPATAHILRDVPMYNDQITGELCTPTGAALLKYFVNEFCNIPVITVDKIGYGMGKKDFDRANCVRSYIGNIGDTNENVAELVCNLDDMTPETVAFAQQLLLDTGALDVYTSPIVMKKGRAGVQFTCMCRVDDKNKMLPLIFKHTTTLGIREYICHRYVLQKENTEYQTKYGAVRIKTSNGFGITKTKPEYDSIAKIARENNISIQEVLKELS